MTLDFDRCVAASLNLDLQEKRMVRDEKVRTGRVRRHRHNLKIVLPQEIFRDREDTKADSGTDLGLRFGIEVMSD